MPRWQRKGLFFALFLLVIIVAGFIVAARAADFCAQSYPAKWKHKPDIPVLAMSLDPDRLTFEDRNCWRWGIAARIDACTFCRPHVICVLEYRNDLDQAQTACLLAGEYVRINALEDGQVYDPQVIE